MDIYTNTLTNQLIFLLINLLLRLLSTHSAAEVALHQSLSI